MDTLTIRTGEQVENKRDWIATANGVLSFTKVRLKARKVLLHDEINTASIHPFDELVDL